MKYIKIKTLKNKLLLSYTLVFAVPMLMIGIFSYNRASSSLESQVKKDTSRSILQTSNSIDNLMTELNRMALLINADDDVLNILRAGEKKDEAGKLYDYVKMQKIIQNAIGFRPDIAGFTIFSDDGRSFSMNDKSVKLGYNFKEQDWYKKLKDSNSYFIGSHYQDYIIERNGEMVVSLVKVIKDTSNYETLGYMMIDYKTKALENILGSKEGLENSGMFIVNASEELIYESKYHICDFNDVKPLTNKLNTSNDVNYSKVQIHNASMILSYYTSPYTGWRVINVIPLNEINKDIKNIRRVTVLIMLLSAALAFLLSLIISTDITVPIKKLREKMKLIEKGDFNIKIDIESQDEIGQLGKSFEKMAKELDKMIKRVYEAELVKQHAEINALQAQINPHFMYNTLAVIDSMAVINGNEDVSNMCRALSKILRYNVEMDGDTTIEREIEQIKLYLYIQSVRCGERFKYSTYIDDEVKDSKIVKLLIQPIVENAVTHGIEGKRGTVKIDISVLKTEENDIEIIIKDTGKGMDEETLWNIQEELNRSQKIYWQREDKGRLHVGIKNVNYRIKLNYGEKYGLYISSKAAEGTTVKLVIPRR